MVECFVLWCVGGLVGFGLWLLFFIFLGCVWMEG